jgi:hypothetical protein
MADPTLPWGTDQHDCSVPYLSTAAVGRSAGQPLRRGRVTGVGPGPQFRERSLVISLGQQPRQLFRLREGPVLGLVGRLLQVVRRVVAEPSP